MASRSSHLVVDSREPWALAEFWAAVLDQPVLYRSDDEVIVGADPHAYPGRCLIRDDGTKSTKNRLHRDLEPDDQEAEVRSIPALGARRADIGRSADVPWVVLADPEGNEFCVLRPHASLIE